ncbi:hypothetical protein TWF696_006827 [Orbilia brochopaga]|uniref:Mitochondrial outer membrane protein OM14 C-terminal domain-containing protein n=1 Tax=Orbilia brochopaga TaxID=3140254 RepID=A0AAV9UTN8_9PEZI
MASYAEVVAKGGPQNPEEAYVHLTAAPPVDTVIPSDSSVASLVDVDSGVSVVSSDFPDQQVKTYTQAERLDLEAAVAAEEEAARAAAAKKGGRSKAADKGTELLAWFKDPVHSGGAVVSTVLVLALGVVGVRKIRAGTFDLKTAGIGAGVLVGFSLVEYYVTKFAQSWVAKKKKE